MSDKTEKLIPEPTVTGPRGFLRARFQDYDRGECSIQDSSNIGAKTIWLGQHECNGCRSPTRMHLTRELAAELIPLLQRFIDTGSIDQPEQFNPYSRDANVDRLTPEDGRSLAGEPLPLKVLVPVTIEEPAPAAPKYYAIKRWAVFRSGDGKRILQGKPFLSQQEADECAMALATTAVGWSTSTVGVSGLFLPFFYEVTQVWYTPPKDPQ